MSEFKERFNEAIEKSGKTRAQISRETGISQAQLHFYSTGRNEPKQNNISLLSRSLNVSVDWLVTGIEPSSESLLVEAYKDLSEDKRRELLRYARYLAKEGKDVQD